MKLDQFPMNLERYNIKAEYDTILGYPRVKMDIRNMSTIQILLVGSLCHEWSFQWWVVNDLICVEE